MKIVDARTSEETTEKFEYIERLTLKILGPKLEDFPDGAEKQCSLFPFVHMALAQTEELIALIKGFILLKGHGACEAFHLVFKIMMWAPLEKNTPVLSSNQ